MRWWWWRCRGGGRRKEEWKGRREEGCGNGSRRRRWRRKSRTLNAMCHEPHTAILVTSFGYDHILVSWLAPFTNPQGTFVMYASYQVSIRPTLGFCARPSKKEDSWRVVRSSRRTWPKRTCAMRSSARRATMSSRSWAQRWGRSSSSSSGTCKSISKNRRYELASPSTFCLCKFQILTAWIVNNDFKVSDF